MRSVRSPKCHRQMEKVEYDIGFGVVVDSLTCPDCRFNITDEQEMDKAMAELRRKTAVRVKVVRIGSGIGIRFPNELAERMRFERGKEVELIQQNNSVMIRRR